jgi:hypothetical protein
LARRLERRVERRPRSRRTTGTSHRLTSHRLTHLTRLTVSHRLPRLLPRLHTVSRPSVSSQPCLEGPNPARTSQSSQNSPRA